MPYPSLSNIQRPVRNECLELAGDLSSTSDRKRSATSEVITQLRPGASTFIAEELLENGARWRNGSPGSRGKSNAMLGGGHRARLEAIATSNKKL